MGNIKQGRDDAPSTFPLPSVIIAPRQSVEHPGTQDILRSMRAALAKGRKIIQKGTKRSLHLLFAAAETLPIAPSGEPAE